VSHRCTTAIPTPSLTRYKTDEQTAPGNARCQIGTRTDKQAAVPYRHLPRVTATPAGRDWAEQTAAFNLRLRERTNLVSPFLFNADTPLYHSPPHYRLSLGHQDASYLRDGVRTLCCWRGGGRATFCVQRCLAANRFDTTWACAIARRTRFSQAHTFQASLAYAAALLLPRPPVARDRAHNAWCCARDARYHTLGELVWQIDLDAPSQQPVDDGLGVAPNALPHYYQALRDNLLRQPYERRAEGCVAAGTTTATPTTSNDTNHKTRPTGNGAVGSRFARTLPDYNHLVRSDTRGATLHHPASEQKMQGTHTLLHTATCPGTPLPLPHHTTLPAHRTHHAHTLLPPHATTTSPFSHLSHLPGTFVAPALRPFHGHLFPCAWSLLPHPALLPTCLPPPPSTAFTA